MPEVLYDDSPLIHFTPEAVQAGAPGQGHGIGPMFEAYRNRTEVRGRPESDRGSRRSGIGPRSEAERNRTESRDRAESDRGFRQTGIEPRFEAERESDLSSRPTQIEASFETKRVIGQRFQADRNRADGRGRACNRTFLRGRPSVAS